MKKNGKVVAGAADAQVLHWQGRVLCAEDLRRNLNGHRELVLLPGTVITPLAADELRSLGIRVNRQGKSTATTDSKDVWGYAQEQPYALVGGVIKSLARDGLNLISLQPAAGKELATLAKAVADCVVRGECQGGVMFCSDPGLACCVANKTKGLRAVAVMNVNQVTRALKSMGANLIAVELPGPTFFEIRQMLRCLCKPSECPAAVARVLQELDGHAHR